MTERLRSRGRRWGGWMGVAVALLVLLHHDVWLAEARHLVLGLPASLLYHLGYCLVASLVMSWLWRCYGASSAASPEDEA